MPANIWFPSDRITAARLNELRAGMERPSQSLSHGSPSQTGWDELGNQRFVSNAYRVLLVQAVEDFETDQRTDLYGVDDECYSGLCLTMRLSRTTGAYEQETLPTPFRVYDPLSLLMGVSPKEEDDIFYIALNPDTSRYEVIGAPAEQTQIMKGSIEEVYCDDPEEMMVRVQWDKWTGGCFPREPWGVDEYDGLIDVYDDCVLRYLNPDDLIGVRIKATLLWVTDEYGCYRRWEIDSACGRPECETV